MSKEVQQADRDSKMANRYSHHTAQVEGMLRAKLVLQIKHSLRSINEQDFDKLDWHELVTKAPNQQ